MASSSTACQRPRPGSRTSKTSTTLTNTLPLHGIPNPSPECAQQEPRTEEEPAGPGDHKNEETVITSIRVTDVAVALRRLPAGFYTTVQHSGREWRTENKPVLVNDDVVEWDGPIPLPSDSSATVCLQIYASFEFQPMLGDGEQLRTFAVTVKQLLDNSANDLPFTFCAEDDDVISPCPSILVTVKRRKRGSRDSLASRALDPHYTTTESRGQLEDATNQGHSGLLRYRKYREKRDLELSIEQFERALDVCPLDHPCRAAAQSNLAMGKFIQCRVADHSLDVPLTLYLDALAARPVGHPDRPSTLIQLAIVHFVRFEKRRHEVDAAQAEALLQEAMDCSSAESHEKRAAISTLQLHAGCKMAPVQAVKRSSMEQGSTSGLTDENPWTLGAQLLRRFERFGDLADLHQSISILEASDGQAEKPCRLDTLGRSFLARFRRLGKPSDLDQAISRHREAVDLTPDGHPHKAGHLNNLVISFRDRFNRLGKLSDLEQAISRYKEAVDLTPDGHSTKPDVLSNLGSFFLTRFNRLGELSDLEEAISRFRDAVDLTPDGHPDKPRHLHHLGSSFFTRFQRLGELGDLEHAISRQKDVVDFIPDGHPEKPCRLNTLGMSFRARFERLGDPTDLEQAISRQRDAVDVTPDGHPHKPSHLNNLGNSLGVRFIRLGGLDDLEQAISRHTEAADHTPDSHPGKPSFLNNLGISFRVRFERFDQLSDLEKAISSQEVAVDRTPEGHPNKPMFLSNLGNSFLSRFRRLGELSDLEQAISRLRHVVDFTPDGHPDKACRLNNLAKSCIIRFERLGELRDLEQAISIYRDAVGLTCDRHPHNPNHMNNLGDSLLTRFKRLGEVSDLEEAISRLGDDVKHTYDGHPYELHHLSSLGNSLLTRFERLGELSDLEEAISRYRDAAGLTPDGHPHKPVYLSNLGACLISRFRQLGELSDLKQGISKHRDAVTITPDNHPHKPGLLNNLGNSLRTRFERLGELRDLEEAISRQRDAVGFTPDGHPDKRDHLRDLGTSFRARFHRLGELGDLEQAISRHREAVDLTPDNHLDKPGSLNNLATSFLARFQRLGEPSDLEEAISRKRDALDLTPEGHPQKPSHLGSLATSFRARFESLGEPGDLEQAMLLYSQAACSSVGPTTDRFHASRDWISCARSLQHRSLLHAYSVSIGLLPQLAWIGLPLTNRYHKLVKHADVMWEAAAAALNSGHPETAVEWLEQGRSIIWGELFQLRSSHEELSSVHPDHARRLRELSVALEHASVTREKLSEHTQSAQHSAPEPLEQEADRHRALAIERDKLLQEIRGFPGFERFLLHKEFSQLRGSAHSGPVVILNAAQSRCDALIVLADKENVVHIPLPSFNFKRYVGLYNTLDSLLGTARVVPCDDRTGQPASRQDFSWESILSTLWKGVVKPVLDALGLSTPGDLSRIFWCPTGPLTFLPIHAAGLYDTQYSEPGHKVFDFVISSYVPTLSVLMSPIRDTTSSGDFRVLAVPQPPSDGQPLLPGVHTELEHIRAVIRNFPAQATLLESSVGTVEEVLGLMKDADWVHFACHGVQDPESPSNSGLCLADERRLKLSDMVSLSRRRGGLAFLSACQTAMGDMRLSDEAVHIAAGMLFAGYGSVVGTMWSISDRVAPYVAKNVYEELFGTGAMPDYREAARALHNAVARLRDNRASFVEWVPFIHVGL